MNIAVAAVLLCICVAQFALLRASGQRRAQLTPWLAAAAVAVATWRATTPDLTAACLCFVAALHVNAVWRADFRSLSFAAVLSVTPLMSQGSPSTVAVWAQVCSGSVALAAIIALSVGLTDRRHLVWALLLWPLPHAVLQPASAELAVPMTNAVGVWTQGQGLRFALEHVHPAVALVWQWSLLLLASVVILRPVLARRFGVALTVTVGAVLLLSAASQVWTLLHGDFLVLAGQHRGRPLWLSKAHAVDWTPGLVAAGQIVAVLGAAGRAGSADVSARVSARMWAALTAVVAVALTAASVAHYQRFGAGVWSDPCWFLLLALAVLGAFVCVSRRGDTPSSPWFEAAALSLGGLLLPATGWRVASVLWG